MPRKTGEDRNFRGDDATNAEVIAAVAANTAAVEGNTSVAEEVDVNIRRLIRGHEANLWDANVTRDDLEE